MDEPSDADLLTRCRAKDPEAWDLLVRRYNRLLRAVAMRNGLSGYDVDDIVQTTFVELLASLDRLSDPGSLKSWLMTVTRRQSWRLRNSNRKDVHLEYVPEEVEDQTEPLADIYSVREALDILTPKERVLIDAMYLDPNEPSYATIAANMGKAVGSLGPARGRALTKLKEHLNV